MQVAWRPRGVAPLLVALAAAFPSGGARAADTGPAPWLLAVVPNRPPLEMRRAWQPLVDRLQRDTGARIQLRFYEGMTRFLDEANAGLPDLLYAAPNLFFASRQRQGYIPLVRSGANVKGLLFVRRDSPVRDVRELDGKTIAFVGPLNVCSVLVRHVLGTTGPSISFKPTYAGSSVNVVKGVLLGKADAGAALDGALTGDPRVDLGELRVILETPPVASHPFAAHPRVPPAIRERFAAALLAMEADDEGRALLAAVRLSAPIRADYARDYGVFAGIALDRLQSARP